MTFREYAEAWRAAQIHRPTTTAHVETMLRRHAYPALGDKHLSAIRQSDVQAWVKGRSSVVAPSTVAVMHGLVAAVFKAAIRDRKLFGSLRRDQAAEARASRSDPLSASKSWRP